MTTQRPRTIEIDLRLEVEADTDPVLLLKLIGENIDKVLSGTVLFNDGYGRLVPSGGWHTFTKEA